MLVMRHQQKVLNICPSIAQKLIVINPVVYPQTLLPKVFNKIISQRQGNIIVALRFPENPTFHLELLME